MSQAAASRKPTRRSLLRGLLASLAILATIENAFAATPLRRRAPGRADPAAAAATTAAAEAAAAERRARSSLTRALESVQAFREAQAAARAAAQASGSAVPDGIAPGGLAVQTGAVPERTCSGGTGLWCGAELPSQTIRNGRTDVTIVQVEPKAILTWESFNVGRNTDLYFDQTLGGDSARSWVALNRVMDPGAAPSRILGSIRAEGQVYVINRNGVLFGGTSRVNVASLVASGLDFAGDTVVARNQLYARGIGQGGAPDSPASIFAVDPADVAEGRSGAITVDAGAQLAAGGYGQILLVGSAAGGVHNAGTLDAPDGQVLLAAGDGVRLARGRDNRGFAPPGVTGGGLVENTGVISTPRGNVTFAGAEARQAGLVVATTSPKANGSIVIGSDAFPVPLVTFGESSVTQILPDEEAGAVAGKSELDGRSLVSVAGERILLLDGATVYVPAGDVALTASILGAPAGTPDRTRIYVGSGARIDVSGLRDVDVAMEKNSVEGELRAAELRDNPVVRESPLRGRKVWFDPRRPPTVAHLEGYADLVPRTASELMTDAGTIRLVANEVVTRAGSVLDLSGGSIRYRDGWVRTTFLVDRAGNRVRIEDAKPGVDYVGIGGEFVVDHARWGRTETYASPLSRGRRFERGYVEGGAAGTLSVSTSDTQAVLTPRADFPEQRNDAATGAFRIFDGSVVAETVVGPRQLAAPPAGATLVLDRAGDVAISGGDPRLAEGFGPEDALDPAERYRHLLPASWFDGRTFANVRITSGFWDDTYADHPATLNQAPGGHFTVGQGVVVDVGTRGTFSFAGKEATIEGTIRAPGGSVSLRALQLEQGKTLDELGPDEMPEIRLGGSAVIDVAGRWSNLHLDAPVTPYGALDGGSVTLTASDVRIEAGSLVDVGGGARLDAKGTKVTAGKGGRITIDVARPTEPVSREQPRDPQDGRLAIDGTLRGYAAGTGGSLTLVTPFDVVIGDALPDGAGPDARLLAPDFFAQGGFSSYAIVGEAGVTVRSGTVLAPSVESLLLRADPRAAGGTPMLELGTRAVRTEADGLALPMTLTLSTVPVRTVPDLVPSTRSGDLVIEDGARIDMAPGSTVRLAAAGTAAVDGTVEALGGTIEVKGDDMALNLPLGPAAVHLGAHARLVASGTQRAITERNGVRRSVEAGGTVVLSGREVTIDEAAVVDASGVAGIADLSAGTAADGEPYLAREVAGSAGSIAIAANTGRIAGSLRLAPGGAGASGGALTIEAGAFRGGGGTILVSQETPGSAAGIVTVSADRVAASGADALVLSTPPDRAVLFEGDVALETRRSIRLLSPVLGTSPDRAGQVTIESGYVQLAGASSSGIANAHAPSLAGDLTVRAGLVDVTGAVTLGSATAGAGGFGTARLVSAGDIRLSSHDASGARSITPGLFSDGALELEAAQVYVASRLGDQIDLVTGLERRAGDPGFLVRSGVSIAVTGNGREAAFPLSFGERLTLRAPAIVQGGVVRAPQGQVRLEGWAADGSPTGSVTLLPGSITSASLEGRLVPFGAVRAGGVFRGYEIAGQAPTKSVTLHGADVDVRPGATIDVSGGGDVEGYAFVPGNGGSADVLGSAGSFAILPSLGAGPAPIGGVPELRDGTLRVGDAVWLEGAPGVAPGFYTLLPAHYALLPGGLLIQPATGSYQGTFATAPDPFVRPDGAQVVSGFRGWRAPDGTIVRDPGYAGWGAFTVMPREVFGQYSEIVTYSFDRFANGLALDAGISVRTPGDAGSAVLNATRSLALGGAGRFGAVGDGLLGNLDITASRIAVVGAGRTAPGAGWLALDPEALAGLGAGSVLLGGTRSQTGSGTALDVVATEVVVDTGNASPWTGPEILLTATGSVTIADGSVVSAEGGISRDTNPLLLTGDGALVRVSTGDRVNVVRTGPGTAGDLTVGAASLSSTGSVTVEASRDLVLSRDAILAAPQIALASTRVNLGTPPAGTPGTTLGAAALERLAAASDLLVRGHESIRFYGDVSLGARDGTGAATLRTLTFDTALLAGDPAAVPAEARITAGELTLRNSGAAAGAPAAGSGTLHLDADLLRLGPGDLAIAGYASVEGTAGALEARGAGGLRLAGDLSLGAGEVRAVSGARYGIDAAGDLAIVRGAAAPAAAASSFGGRLAISGATVLLDTAVVLPAGAFEATARSGALTLGAHAAVDASGRAVPFDEQVRFAPGGSIRLEAQGDVAVAQGAALDVSGAPEGGDAGRIDVLAAGGASVEGTLLGSEAAGWRGGSFSLDAATSDLAALNAALEAGGFQWERTLRLRQQDVVLGAGEVIRAHDVTLRSDAGLVRVGGEIAARGDADRPDGGTIRIAGGAGVRVEGTARLDAAAADARDGGFAPSSGSIEIAAEGGTADVAAGAILDVTGGKDADGNALAGGTVVVRASRRRGGDPDDLAIDSLAGEIRGARAVVVQGVQRIQATDVTASLVGDAATPGTLLGDAAAWLRGSDSIRARLGVADLQVAPGIEVESAGALTVSAPIDLHAIGAPGYLGLLAGGTLAVNATVSDGFDGSTRTANLLDGTSFSYRLEGGRDGLLPPEARAVVLAPGVMVRTGTGGISIEAGGDVVLSDPKSVPGASALPPPVVYTAGRLEAPAPGFLGAPAGMTIGAFPAEGGDVVIRAGRDVSAPVPRQTTSAWLFRDGASTWGDADTPGDASTATVSEQTSWSVVFRNFEQAVGALGGGDVFVRAGRDVSQLQVAIPTTGHLTTAPGQVPQADQLFIRGGGDLELEAGRDLVGGLFVLGRGEGRLRSGGMVRAGPNGVGVLVGLIDATATLTATSGIQVQAAFDPMRQGQIAENLGGGTAGAAFWGYTERTALTVMSLAGDVRYQNDPLATVRAASAANQAESRYLVTMTGTDERSLNQMFARAPPTMRVLALEGSIVLGNAVGQRAPLLLAPAPRGNLEALAARNLQLPVSRLELEDVAPEYGRGPLFPFATDLRNGTPHFAEVGNWPTFDGEPTTNSLRGFTPIHAGDPEPVRLYALEGSVCAYQTGSCTPSANPLLAKAEIVTPKPIDVLAGRDVVAGNYQPQNNGSADLTSVRAGRDVYEATLQVGGVGVAVVEAGRDVVQHIPSAAGVESLSGGLTYGKGDGSRSALTYNAALPAGEGASLLVLAGAEGMDLDGFADAYLDPSNGAGVAATYLEELAGYMAELGQPAMGADELLAAFRALPRTRREHFLVDRVYFEELKRTGIEYNDASSPRYRSYDRGFRAVSLLFPEGTAPRGGDAILNGKPLETWADGDIAVVAPHGRVGVGSDVYDTSSGGGIVTRRGGDIRVMADGNIDLFTSRVFTLQGGDITMWTSNGSITAGAGSKTSVVDVPLSYTMSSDAVVAVNVFGLQTGAGIGVLDALDGDGDRPRSRLDLIAPRGEVNAGDAGIRVVGDINVAAAVVVGMENISATGASAGVPKVEVPNVGVLTTAARVAQAEASAKEGTGPDARAKAAAELPSIITVEVVGYETAAPDGRNESPDGEAREDARKRERGRR